MVDAQADLSSFGLGPMVRLVAGLRERTRECSSVQDFAQQLCDFLHGCFLAADGSPQTALVRYYGTGPLRGLPPEDQAFARQTVGVDLSPETTCLTLLGTAGVLPEWNDRLTSAGHRVLVLQDAERVTQMPMVAGLLGQLGIDIDALVEARSDLVLVTPDEDYRVFHVPVALGSPLIPAQDFVREHGIASAFGFGGALPTGEVFAVVIFSQVAVPLEVAQLFSTVALSTSLASCEMFDLPLLDGLDPAARGADRLSQQDRMEARSALTRTLLRVHERAAEVAADGAALALGQVRYEASVASALAAVALRLGGVRTVAEVTETLLADGLRVLGADGLSLALTDPDQTSVSVAVSGNFGDEISRRYAQLPLDDTYPTTVTARTGETFAYGDVRDAGDRFPALVSVAAGLNVKALTALPLWVSGRLIGALTCTWSEMQSFSPAAMEVMTALASQAAQALDRTRLLELERSHSGALQRSLLSAPPQPDHCEIVVRYHPAAEVAQVGGDWYDAFMQRGGETVLVIGDVVGHDTAAAAAMAQVRVLLRGIAWHTGAGPAEVLQGVDAAIQGLDVHTTASAIVGRLEQTEQELDEEVTRLRWSNAGHPPPLVVTPEGDVSLLALDTADLLLGIDLDATRQESEVTLQRGSTIVFFTDGLVERRNENLDEGLDRLRGTLSAVAHLPLQELCDELLLRELPGSDDDVALLAVRLHPQDRPRPVEAGPEVLPPLQDPED
ncbi:MAG TPA: GAF domain-containing SpoIIE family protein phosphatase [Mycobacteriales bacterium]|nr:GAF domain-containing SpoIIE family protein phosphatase [Mycobacteriales bacterium]